ncbi:MAG: XdhC family protein [Proteobacteria bacterium]|nr:XdhC family protein [Pseudomonadota bacterium]
MKDIYRKVVELFAENRMSVLATIIKQTGSAPRGMGTKFLIMEDGSFVGTIGGGLLEAKVLEGAKKVFETRLPERLSFILKGVDVAGTDMLCGGDAEVFLEPLSPEHQTHLEIMKRSLEIQKWGGSGLLALSVLPDRWKTAQVPKVFLQADGGKIGSLPGMEDLEERLVAEMPRLLKGRQPTIAAHQDKEGNPLEFYLEPIMSDPVLYVFGGGHVSLQIVPLAGLVGFKVVVIDDRPEFADPRKFPAATNVLQYPFEGVLDRLAVDDSSYLVIVTRGHLHDKTVLTQCLKTDAKYIGMIGSRRKVAILFKALLGEGFSQDKLDRVHAPIGLDIGAETPEEIAVSIVAELISIRAGRKR